MPVSVSESVSVPVSVPVSMSVSKSVSVSMAVAVTVFGSPIYGRVYQVYCMVWSLKCNEYGVSLDCRVRSVKYRV